MPVTISGFKTGSILMFKTVDFCHFFNEFIPIAENVPITVESIAATPATSSVL